jgi:general secretion pathway protein L
MASPALHQRSPIHRAIASASAALDWWLAELGEILGQILRFRQAKPLRFRVAPGDELLPAEGDPVKAGRSRHVCLLLDENQFLYRKVKLPLAARKNIASVIGYEFNKYFPMSAEDALFSCRAIATRPGANSIEVEIWAIGRKQINMYLAMLRRQYDFDADMLYIADSAGQLIITHNIEQERRLQSDDRHALAGQVLNIVLASLVVALLAYPVFRMDAYLETQQQEIKRLEKKAQPVIETRAKVMAMDQRFQQLVDRKMTNPARADVWSYLTRAVDDQAILQRMTISGRRVRLAGKAPSVERLLRKLEKETRISEVKIVGQVKATKDNAFESLNLDLELRE